ncbi:AFG3-like protein 1 [Enhydra lutris kenyoni]|uniref:AFG3-like protein 1 n=1 Tax=Enhydra lutris kenyoni TaxID=391180 RepID=A0A2Y9KCP2_ENHLU|nr:AFG3-like protein 1 [Enhydra lutris kenyoni]XP_022367174.1 AFG3-like protein 1 [Enhydra lutris kenyoni]XP_022367175.1 AFG3-like protein 1 [Enhydra lutris kenyoni]XP_022367176.1 AFG3-like protein 1 [Enhydra lutris kenyoni]XP_022367177.1 AFG3-like protein 1 [Enhydra lutris kenyoni]XP_022367178.1 AFG3-like protein 1 [Enhydra lutris kenyoni]
MLVEIDGERMPGTAAETRPVPSAPPEPPPAFCSCKLPGVRLSTSTVVPAGTSCPVVLDPALTQPGLSDRLIHVGTPDVRGRASIFRVHLCPLKLDKSLQKDTLAGKLLVLVWCFPDCAFGMSEELGQVSWDLSR